MTILNLSVLLILFLGLLLPNGVESHTFANPKSHIKVKNIQEKNLHPKYHENSPQISVTPTLLSTSGEYVTVTWSGISSPSSNDWVGVYSPANADRTTTAPIKYRWANTSSTHLSTGSGSVQFSLTNGREDYSITFFQNGLSVPVSIVTTEVIEFKNYNEPLQGRLSLTPNDDEMRVMWVTRDSQKPQVKWGESSGKYKWVVDAESFTFGPEAFCGEPANSYGWKAPGLFHVAILTNLQKGKQYFYIYGSEDDGWSQESSFFPILGADPTEKIRFYAFGDLGQAPVDGSKDPDSYQPHAITNTNLMVEDLAKHKNDTHLVLHIGDISYAMGYEAEWDDFGIQMAPLAEQLAYQTSPGNHESDWPATDTIFNGTDSYGECGVPFYLRFPIPEWTLADLDKTGPQTHWYSFNTGPVHIIMLSTEQDFTVGSTQYEWLQEDLASVDRSLTPWILLTGHRPMYVDSTNNEGTSSDGYAAELLRQNVEPLMIKYQVDVGFWGHHHSYQRTCLVQNTVCSAKATSVTTGNTTVSYFHTTEYVAPVNFLIGMAGASHSTNLATPQPDYIEYVNDSEHGYTVVEIDSDKSFHLSFITITNELRDDFWLYKDY